MAVLFCSDVNTVRLQAQHEETDTRIIFLCIENDTNSRDTDILVMLLGHYFKMPCTELWI